jgi:hypothetical protein
MTRASKKPPKAPPGNGEAKASDATPPKVQVQFGPSPSAPGSRLKRAKGA